MAYVPINVAAFTTAYSGALAGMAVSGWISSSSLSNYDAVTKVAGAFAQAFDQVWNNATQLNNLEIQAITSASQAEFSGRGPSRDSALQAASYWSIPAGAVAALVLMADAYFAGQGINPGTPGGSADLVVAQAWNTTELNTFDVNATENFVLVSGANFAASSVLSSAFAFDPNGCKFTYTGSPILVRASALVVLKQFTFAGVFVTPTLDLNGDTLTQTSQTDSGQDAQIQTTLDFVEMLVSSERLLSIATGDVISASVGATTGAAPIGSPLEVDRLLLTITQCGTTL